MAYDKSPTAPDPGCAPLATGLPASRARATRSRPSASWLRSQRSSAAAKWPWGPNGPARAQRLALPRHGRAVAGRRSQCRQTARGPDVCLGTSLLVPLGNVLQAATGSWMPIFILAIALDWIGAGLGNRTRAS